MSDESDKEGQAKAAPKPKPAKPKKANAKKARIDVLLVELGLCDSRAKAQARVLAGEVVVNDQRVDKAGTKVPADAEIRFKGESQPYVSRGGLKLERALKEWPIDLAGKVCVDVGASTGGFTDVLLKSGAGRVYAIDVGYGQLAWSIRQDERVVNMERTHIGKLEVGALDPAPEVCVIDVSFISLNRVIPAVAAHLTAASRIYALIKPQFEVGRENIGKGGIVRDEVARQAAVDRVLDTAQAAGFTSLGVVPSPITGADGNVEFVTCMVREEQAE